MTAPVLTLIGKPGCHLCDDARDVVTAVLADLDSAGAASETPPVVFEEKSILDDAALHERFVEEIPVVLINGAVHNYWRIDPVRLKTAILEAQ